jgi:hypothetical protein
MDKSALKTQFLEKLKEKNEASKEYLKAHMEGDSAGKKAAVEKSKAAFETLKEIKKEYKK